MKAAEEMKREELQSIFDALRNDPSHHLGLGDIRLTIAQQDEILAMVCPLPPAEGAEAILARRWTEKYPSQTSGYGRSLFKEIHSEWVIAAMQEFAAQPQPTAEGAEANRHIRQLKEFHTAFNLPQRDIPTIIPPDEFKLRHKILVEEVGELSDAYFVDDIVEVADAITDCLYVLIGTALQFGIADKLEACFDEVHRSNMSKLGNDGYPIMREDGKVMKGENYTRPDLKSILSEPIVAQQQPTAEGAEEILNKYPHSIEYPMFIHENNALAAMQEFATLHAQRLAEKMVEEKMPSNKKIHEAALAWAKEHSNAPDKDCPDWLIRDYEAGAYFVRQCMGCWNKV